jgi:hypothetical protein
MTAAVEADGLVKRYGALLAVDELSFSVAAGGDPGRARAERRRQDDRVQLVANSPQREERPQRRRSCDARSAC